MPAAPSSFVLTASPSMPAQPGLERAVRELLGDVEVSWQETAAGRGTLSVDELRVDVELRPCQVPNAEADTAAFLSLSAVRDDWRLPKHGAHLTLTRREGRELVKPTGLLGRVMGSARPATAVESLSRFTKVVAAVTRAVEAVGVYWGAAPVTHQPGFFVDLARETEVPIPLWLGVSITPEADGRVQVLSLGMGQLGLPDLLLAAPKKDPGDVLDFFFSTLTVLAEQGTPFPEGYTVSRSLLERLTVRYGPSPLDPQQRVFKLDLP